MNPSSAQAALVSARSSLLLAAVMHHPARFSCILRAGLALVTLSEVVSNGQVDVDGGYIAERQRVHTHGMDAHLSLFSTGFRQVDVGGGGRWISARTGVPLLEVGEREAKVVDTTYKMFGAMWTADAEEVELSDNAMTILCDMLAACTLLEVLSSMDFALLDAEVWTDLAAIPLRTNMPSSTTDVLVAIHVEESSF